jgi:DNA polymerase-1
MSKDENMISAFNQNLDIHTATAAKVFGVAYEEVDKEMRRRAKTVNFGIIYGISAFGLSERIGISRTEAKAIIDNYFLQFPAIKKYMDDTIAFAKEHGYVKTLLGRRRYVPDIHSNNATVRGFAERNAINAPIQGTAADMIKIAMIEIHSALKEANLKSKMILQVHDELVFDVLHSEMDKVKSIALEKMQKAMKLEVPLVAEYGVGENWLEAH